MCDMTTKRTECERCGKNYIITIKEDITPQKKYYDANKNDICIKQRAYDVANKEKKRAYYQIKKIEKAEMKYQMERLLAEV